MHLPSLSASIRCDRQDPEGCAELCDQRSHISAAKFNAYWKPPYAKLTRIVELSSPLRSLLGEEVADMRQRLIHLLETSARWCRQPLLKQVIYPTFGILVLMAISSAIFWLALVDQERRIAHAALSAKAQDLMLEVESRMRGYRQILRGARALFNASVVVTEREWQVYVANLDLHEEFSGFLGVGFARYLNPEQRQLYDVHMRNQNQPQQQLWPAGDRAHYSVIMFLEPRHRFNLLALGYDMLSEARRNTAMWRAARENRSVITAPVELVQERIFQAKEQGMLMYLPVYLEHPPPLDEEQRLKLLQGWVYMPFRMSEFMSRLTSYMPPDTVLTLYDGEQPSPESLYWSNRPALPSKLNQTALVTRHTQRLYTNGRTWTFELSIPMSSEPFLSERRRRMSVLGLLNVLIVGIVLALATARYRAGQLMFLSRRLSQAQEGYRTVVELSSEGIAAVDHALSLTFVNQQLAEMLSTNTDILIQKPLRLFWVFDAEFSEALLLEQLQLGQRVRREIRLQRQDREPLHVLVSVSPLLEGAQLKGATLIFTDISQLKAKEAQVAYLATHDAMTGLLNRTTFQEHMVQVWEEARRYGRCFALLYVDLDCFKPINDTFGHTVGDEVLVEVARRMVATVRRSDLVGRRGGDEFVLLLPELGTVERAQVVAEKLRVALEEPIELPTCTLQISCSIGIGLYPDDAEDVETLISKADMAMYHAKQAGGNRFEFCLPHRQEWASKGVQRDGQS